MHATRRPSGIDFARHAAIAMLRRQRGLGLLETMFLVLLIGGALLAAFTHLREQAPRQQAEAQAAALAWADRALIGFAAANARLPCPATQPDGAEDCSGSAPKGWLPVATLSLAAANPGPGALPMGYVVYRGAGGSDLVSLTDQFNPHGSDGSVYDTFGALNGADFCVALAQAQANPAATAQAYFMGASGVVNVAYGIVATSPLGGSGTGLFDGVNIGSGAQVEAPTRPLTPDYGDRVRVRGFDTLAVALSCKHVLASLDGMALAVGVVDDVLSAKDSLRDSAVLASAMNGVVTAVQLVNVVMSGIALAGAITALSAATAELTAAIVGCIFLVGCAFIPTAAAAVGFAAAAIGTAVTALVLNAAALAANIAATVQTSIVAVQLGAPFDPADPAALDEAIATAHDSALAADQVAANARNDYNDAVSKRDQAAALQADAWNAVRIDLADQYPDDDNTALLNDLHARMDDHVAALQALAAATSARQTATKRITDLADALILAQADYTAKVAAWQAETDPQQKLRRQAEMTVAADTVTSIQQSQVDAANDLIAAQLAEQQATAGVAAADSALDAAVDALVQKYPSDASLGALIATFQSAYEDYIGKRDFADSKYQAMQVAEAKAQDAWDGYNQLLAIQIGGNGPGGDEVPIGAAQRDILEAADQRGAVQ